MAVWALDVEPRHPENNAHGSNRFRRSITWRLVGHAEEGVTVARGLGRSPRFWREGLLHWPHQPDHQLDRPQGQVCHDIEVWTLGFLTIPYTPQFNIQHNTESSTIRFKFRSLWLDLCWICCHMILMNMRVIWFSFSKMLLKQFNDTTEPDTSLL